MWLNTHVWMSSNVLRLVTLYTHTPIGLALFSSKFFEFLETVIDQTGPHEILRMSGDLKFFYLKFPISGRYLIKLRFDNETEVCSGDFYFIIGVKRMTRFER